MFIVRRIPLGQNPIHLRDRKGLSSANVAGARVKDPQGTDVRDKCSNRRCFQMPSGGPTGRSAHLCDASGKAHGWTGSTIARQCGCYESGPPEESEMNTNRPSHTLGPVSCPKLAQCE
ncbi:hypothetical protein HHI36_007886 [Cryptolaemus montrouzieri]|uniref:Uncharacterized protein n=1 Tax=Cryptolaemus montrouzieri TaxID=559131 RepID=A0ABD2MRC5_9CUCU